MSQTRYGGAKHNSPFLHTSAHATPDELRQALTIVLDKNPGLTNYIRPDYQHNAFDPPHDLNTAHFLNDLEKTWPHQRHKLLRKFLPKELYQFKSYLSRLPVAQLQQLREQIYIARIGDLGTNAPCQFSRRHWIHRLTAQHPNMPITQQTLSNLTLSERVRWYETAIMNLYVDAAEEEYIRYKFCIGNRMPLVNKASIHNTAHYNPSEQFLPPSPIYPSESCRSLMGMVHDSHRYWAEKIRLDCSHYFPDFYRALVSDSNLNEALIRYDTIQRCALGRELRARVMTKPPLLAGAWQIFGRTFPDKWVPSFLINIIEIRSNPVVKYHEKDDDILPIFHDMAIPKVKPLLDEIRQELIQEGRLAPIPGYVPKHSANTEFPGQYYTVENTIKKAELEPKTPVNENFYVNTPADRLFNSTQLADVFKHYDSYNQTDQYIYKRQLDMSKYINHNAEHSFVDMNSTSSNTSKNTALELTTPNKPTDEPSKDVASIFPFSSWFGDK